MINKLVQVEHQAENAQLVEEEMEQDRREFVNDVVVRFNPAISKTKEHVVKQVNSKKALNDHVDRDILVDWKKEMMEGLVKFMLEKNLPAIDLATLVIRGASKSPFAY